MVSSGSIHLFKLKLLSTETLKNELDFPANLHCSVS